MPPSPGGAEFIMQLRCKEGDLAFVVRDFEGCEANLGRLVHVRGPVISRADVGPTWLITPVTSVPWTFLDLDGSFHVEFPLRDLVEHPDAWLIPIREQPGASVHERGGEKKLGEGNADSTRPAKDLVAARAGAEFGPCRFIATSAERF
jgi:hypothetical protein